MEIAAAEAEGADGRPPRVSRSRQPWPAIGIDIEGRRSRGESVEGPAHLDGRRQDLVMESGHRFDEPGCSGGGLGVADLRLHRAESDPRAPAARGPKDLP